jgi:hypothetical protein
LKVLAIGNRTTLDDNLVSSVFHAYIISNKNNSAKILSEIYF